MKKFLRLSMVILMISSCLIGATACSSPQVNRDEQPAQNQVAPKSDDSSDTETPDIFDMPELPDYPENPDVPRIPEHPKFPDCPRCPRLPNVSLPHERTFEDDEDSDRLKEVQFHHHRRHKKNEQDNHSSDHCNDGEGCDEGEPVPHSEKSEVETPKKEGRHNGRKPMQPRKRQTSKENL